MSRFGLIAGSGELPWRADWSQLAAPQSPYGEPSSPPLVCRIAGREIVKIARHGTPHRFAPHAVNYRANIHTMTLLGVDGIIAINTVGGISEAACAGALLIPDQLIDYTWGRPSTFSDDAAVRHVDFTEPYDGSLRELLHEAAVAGAQSVVVGGTMGVTQGPRLETAAEISRMASDGCAVVGMTGMPEAILAREQAIPYASLCLVVNPAAGVGNAAALDMAAIKRVGERGLGAVGQLLLSFFERL